MSRSPCPAESHSPPARTTLPAASSTSKQQPTKKAVCVSSRNLQEEGEDTNVRMPVALAALAPVESVTVPSRVAFTACAYDLAGSIVHKQTTTHKESSVRLITEPPGRRGRHERKNAPTLQNLQSIKPPKLVDCILWWLALTCFRNKTLPLSLLPSRSVRIVPATRGFL